MERDLTRELWQRQAGDPLRPQLENALALVRAKMAAGRAQQSESELRKGSRT
jgi:hypothetical protein